MIRLGDKLQCHLNFTETSFKQKELNKENRMLSKRSQKEEKDEI